jgi:hypothetical protein
MGQTMQYFAKLCNRVIRLMLATTCKDQRHSRHQRDSFPVDILNDLCLQYEHDNDAGTPPDQAHTGRRVRQIKRTVWVCEMGCWHNSYGQADRCKNAKAVIR